MLVISHQFEGQVDRMGLSPRYKALLTYTYISRLSLKPFDKMLRPLKRPQISS